jgi:hypothetical protein
LSCLVVSDTSASLFFFATTLGVLLFTTTFLGAVPEELTTTLFLTTGEGLFDSSCFSCLIRVALVF